MNDAKALDAELTGLVYDSEVIIVDEDGVERRNCNGCFFTVPVVWVMDCRRAVMRLFVL